MYENDGGFKPRRSFTAPVKVGDEFDVKIEAVGEKGDGIAKKDGFVLFVPNTNEGDEVKIKVTRVLRKVGFAEVLGEGSAPAESEQSEDAPAEDTTKEAQPEGSEEKAAEPEKKKEVAPAEDSEDFGEDVKE